MNLSLKSFTQFVQDMGAALQSSATTLVDVSVGSIARALFEANAGVALWMQWMILQVLQTTRAATSIGSDLDSWMADFGLTRLPASFATGTVTFLRYAANLPASIPPGTIVKSNDGSLSFSVITSQAISIWDNNSNAYILPAGIASALIPVKCNQAGVVGNAVASSIGIIASSLPGIDQVTNPAPLTGGRDAETDEGFRSRFVKYLNSLPQATLLAVQTAIDTVQQGLISAVFENVASDGSALPGHFVVVIDDGSGYPSEALISTVTNAINDVRPVGTSMSVIAPTVVTVSVTMGVIIPQTSSSFGSAQQTIQAAIQNYLDSLSIGRAALVSKIVQLTYAAVPDSENILNVLLNGMTQDFTPTAMAIVKAGKVTVTVNAS